METAETLFAAIPAGVFLGLLVVLALLWCIAPFFLFVISIQVTRTNDTLRGIHVMLYQAIQDDTRRREPPPAPIAETTRLSGQQTAPTFRSL